MRCLMRRTGTETRKDCNGCPDRRVGCHGKNEDGTWKCRIWAKIQEKKEPGEKQRKDDQAYSAYMAEYTRRQEMRRKWHHK